MDVAQIGLFEKIYKSDLQSVYALWIVPLLFLAYLLVSPRARERARSSDPEARFVHLYAIVFAIETVLDSFATGPLSRWLGISDHALGTIVLITFVLLGDFRVFLLVFRLARPEQRLARTLRAAALWTVIVPLFSVWSDFGLRTIVSNLPGQAIWLTYELAFLAVAIFLRNGWIPAQVPASRADTLDSLRAVTTYVAVYYFLWALADVLILIGGWDLGWALRILPNQLYYAFFLPFVYFKFFARR